MEDIASKLSTIMADPQMMSQIMSMAQALGASEGAQQTHSAQAPDLQQVGVLAQLAGSTSVKPEQQALLQALQPYLSQNRLNRLEKAMQAAGAAKLASTLLGQGGLSFLTGR